MVPEQLAYHLYSLDQQYALGIVHDGIIAHVDKLLHCAIERGASDIHLQPHEQVMVVRERIDGYLYDAQHVDRELAPLLISRIKILAHMDIAKRRLPQDGRMNVVFHAVDGIDRVIDLRVSSFPTLYGEKLVLRILDQGTHLMTLAALGLDLTTQQELESLLKRPYGLFLVTGPTGCGKTTMLYAMLSSLNNRSKNMVTLEDPIEYLLPGMAQSQINVTAGFTFEVGLRALLRQDPDIIMLGEIRDKETANIAMEAALTGHLVFSTLHTNNALSAVMRLIDMGVEPFLISATLMGVLAQRLVRRLCAGCKQKSTVPVGLQQVVQTQYGPLDTVYQQSSCSLCHHRGFKGQIGIFELLTIDPQASALIGDQDYGGLQELCAKKRMRSMLQDGIAKVEQGITTLDEVFAVAQ
ncbi:type II/IV secretion system protein [Candidatus Dependentiae bacterium]|nr:type II/IV secretion system protein [Candidatus Dependentiae bacterium]